MSKNSKCYVPNCRSGYTNEEKHISKFAAPKDTVLRNLWDEAIPRADRNLSDRDVVCEKHFFEEDIIRTCKIGETLIKYKRPKLAPMAIPQIFSKHHTYLRTIKTKKKHELVTKLLTPKKIMKWHTIDEVHVNHMENHSNNENGNTQTINIKSVDLNNYIENQIKDNIFAEHIERLPNDNSTNTETIKIVYIDNDDCSEQNSIEHTGDNNCPLEEILSEEYIEALNDRENNVTDNHFEYLPEIEYIASTVEVVSVENNKTLTENKNDNKIEQCMSLFTGIFASVFLLKIPNHWATYKLTDERGKYILFTEMSIMEENPVLQRQLLLNEVCQLTFYYRYQVISAHTLRNTVRSKAELEDALAQFASFKICEGGPTVASYPNINLTYVFQDRHFWRHKKCTYINDTFFENCFRCRYLKTRFKNINKRTRVSLGNLSLQEIKAERSRLNKMNTRLKAKVCALSEELCDMQNKFRLVEELLNAENLGSLIPSDQKEDD